MAQHTDALLEEINDLEDERTDTRRALCGLLGLVDLLLMRRDLPPEVREVLRNNHRVAEARRVVEG